MSGSLLYPGAMLTLTTETEIALHRGNFVSFADEEKKVQRDEGLLPTRSPCKSTTDLITYKQMRKAQKP